MTAAPSDDARALRVVIAAEHALEAECVNAALAERGYDPELLRWPLPADETGSWAVRRSLLRGLTPPPEVGVLLSGAVRPEHVATAVSILQDLSFPWLVLSSAPPGPVWGALYDNGASLVVSIATGLELVCGLIDEVGAGRDPAGSRERKELVREWHGFEAERHELEDRLASLTVRERQVLMQLYDGVGVRLIAEDAEVAEATVRSQVKAILKKLGVSSQIAAVAAFTKVDDDLPLSLNGSGHASRAL